MTRYRKISWWAVLSLIFLTPLPKASAPEWAKTCIHLISVWAVFFFLLDKIHYYEPHPWNRSKSPLEKPLIALLFLSVLSGIFSTHLETSIWALILLANYMTLFFLISTFIQIRDRFKQLTLYVIGTAGFLSLFGVLKWLGINPFYWWEYKIEEFEMYRLTSTFVNANHFAAYLEMTIPLILGLILTGYLDDKIIPALIVCLIMIFAFILTHSRAGWIGFFVGSFFLATVLLSDRQNNKNRVFWGFSAGLVIILITFLVNTSVTERTLTLFQMDYIPNLRDRMVAWKGIIQMISDYPILGTGPGTFSTIFTQYQPAGTGSAFYNHAHNDYLEFVSELGIFMIPLLIWLTLAVFRNGFKKMHHPSRLVRGATAGAMAGFVSIMVHTIADFPLQIPANVLILTILVALVVTPVPKS